MIALLELTCPLERNLSKANLFKNDKYASMQGDLEEKGLKVHLLPIFHAYQTKEWVDPAPLRP